MKNFDSDQTRSALPFERLVPALRHMFVEGCEVPLRHTHTLAAPDGTQNTVLIMPAWQTGRYLGIKTVSIFPGNTQRGLPSLFSTYMLYDANTGVPLARIDGDQITARRTVAASALAASFLARPDARRLLVVGSGRVASLLPEAYQGFFPLDRIEVWSRSESHARELVERLRTQGMAARVAPDLAAAVAQADIVGCATLSTEPLVCGQWLAPGSHLDLIGGFTPQMREADDACFARAHIYVDTDEAVRKSGDLLGPMARGVFTAADVRGTLADLCRGSAAGRKDPTARTVFKSVGSALEDLAAAVLVYESMG